MADKILLVGGTGLVGGLVVQNLLQQGRDKHLHMLFRRPFREDVGGAKTYVKLQEDWPKMIAGIKPDIVISTLGTTIKKAKSKDAFAAVDRDLVLSVAEAAKKAGARQFITVSSAMAKADSSTFYLKVKGETEEALKVLNFDRLDILQPGLLRGERGNDHRLGERLAIAFSPITDLAMQGPLKKFRSILASDVADAIAALAGDRGQGVFVHGNDAIDEMV